MPMQHEKTNRRAANHQKDNSNVLRLFSRLVPAD